HASVPAELMMHEAPLGLKAKVAKRAASAGQRSLVGQHDSSFAGRDELVRIEAQRADVAEAAARPALVTLTVHLGCVLDYFQAEFLRQREYRVHIHRQTVRVDYENGLRSRCDSIGDLRGGT